MLASYFFYLSASVKYGVFLIFSTIIIYLAALILDRISAKGSYVSTDCTPCEPNRKISDEDKAEIYPTADKYLRMIIELYKDKGIEVLLFNATAFEEHESLPRCNAVNGIANEYGLEFLDFNMMTEKIGFDPATDYRDPWHCNVSRAMKVTEYLGEFMKNNYSLLDRRNDNEYDFRDKQLIEYRSLYSY